MKPESPPNAWSIFAVPGVFGILYCVLQCLYFPTLPSMVPVHFDAGGMPVGWAHTGPLILLALAFLIVLFILLGYVFTRGMEQPRLLSVVAVLIAGICGVQAGGFLAILRFLQFYKMFPIVLPLAFGVGAAVAEGIVLLAVNRKIRPSSSSAA